MSATIKPEIYISWIPTGKIIFKPKVFVTYSPKNEKVLADLSRKISNNESNSVDLLREVIQNESIHADLLRAVVDSQYRVHEKTQADTNRKTARRESFLADTLLKTANSEKIPYDLLRGLRDLARADSFRQVTRSEKIAAGTVIRTPHIMKYVVQQAKRLLNKSSSKRLLGEEPSVYIGGITSTLEHYGATNINITLNERTLSDELRFDITKSPISDMPDIGEAISATLLDYEFNCIIEEITQTDLVMSVKAKYQQEDLLYTWLKLKDIMVTAQSESTSSDSDGGEGSGGGENDSDPSAIQFIKAVAHAMGFREVEVRIDNFTPSDMNEDNVMTYADIVSNLFSWTSRIPQRQVNVFIRGDKFYCIQRGKENKNATFDITNLPHSRPIINKKIVRVLCHNPANDNDDNNDDGDDKKKPFSGSIGLFSPTFSISYHYQNGLLTSEDIHLKNQNENGENVEYTSSKAYTYKSHSQIIITTEQDDNKDEEINYDTETTFYMSSKKCHDVTTTNGVDITDTQSITTYGYKGVNNDLYLFLEQEITTIKEYAKTGIIDISSHNEDITEQTHKETYHVPVGNGFYAQTTYLNGIVQGGNISQGKPGNAVSQVTVDQFQETFYKKEDKEDKEELTDENSDQLSMIEDNSFPVDSKTKKELNAALRNLHGKTAKTVTVNLISRVTNGVPEITHIVDFTERVVLDGEEYYLVSNNISFTPRKFIQKLQLIRWEGL